MTYGRKTGGRDIKPGQVLNPKGRPRVDYGVKVAKLYSQNELIMSISRLIKLNADELKEVLKDPKTPACDAVIASVMIKSILKGDMSQFDQILNRVIGKVKDRVIVENLKANPYEEMSLDDIKAERERLYRRKQDILGKLKNNE